MELNKLLKKTLLCSAGVVALGASPAFAQIEEIVITAQKREQSLQDVPIAVSAFTGEDLQDQGITSVIDLQDVTPNLRIKQNNGAGIPRYAIRGVGDQTDSSSTSSSPVAIHINEVPHPYPVTSTNLLFDLERVEILRGPQGDLFGLNTTGGTINYVTAKPTADPEAQVMIEVGNFNATKFEGYVSGPLTDSIRARLAVSQNIRGDGWQDDFESDQTLGEMRKAGIRLTLDADLSDRMDASLEMHYTRDDSDAIGTRLQNTLMGASCYISYLYAYVPDLASCVGAGLTSGPNTGDFRDAGWSKNSVFFPANTKPFIDHEGAGGSLRVNYEGDNLSLVSLTGYETHDRSEFIDYDGSELFISNQVFQSDLTAWSQEFRLSNDQSSDIRWVLGANYAKDTLDVLSIFEITDEILLEFPGIGGNAPHQKRKVWAVFGHAEADVGEKTRVSGGLRYTDEERTQTNQGTFIYGDGSDLVTALAGGAWGPGATVWDQGDTLTDADFSCFAIAAPCAPYTGPDFTGAVASSGVSWKLGIDYRQSEDWLLYASVANGTKSGGFGDYPQSSSSGLAQHEEEELLAYEVGAKGTIADGRLRFNGAAFWYDYSDQQVANFIVDPLFGPLIAQVNAPKSTIKGFEAEMKWLPTDRVTIIQNIGYAVGTFDDFDAIDDSLVYAQAADPGFVEFTSVGATVSKNGDDIGFPELSLNGSFAYEWPLGRSESLFGQIVVDYSYESETKLGTSWFSLYGTVGGPVQTGSDDMGSHTTVNARASIISDDGWTLTAFVRNLADAEHVTFVGNWNSDNTTTPNMPRTYGVRAKFDL